MARIIDDKSGNKQHEDVVVVVVVGKTMRKLSIDRVTSREKSKKN